MRAKQLASHNRLRETERKRKTAKEIKKKFQFSPFFCYTSQQKNASNLQNCNHFLSKNYSSNRGLFNTYLRQYNKPIVKKISPKISKMHEKPPNEPKIHEFRSLTIFFTP